jgi:hypothetical protein
VVGGAISAPRKEWELAFETLKQMRIIKHVVPWRAIDVALALLGSVVLAGLLIQIARGQIIASSLVLMYLAALTTMATSYFSELPRYVWAMSPLLMQAAFIGAAVIHQRLAATRAIFRRTSMVAASALIAAVVALNASSVGSLYASSLHTVRHADWNGRPVEYRLFTYDPDYPQVDAALEWLKEHAISTDVVASTTPHWVYVRTSIKAVLPPFELDPVIGQRQLDSVPVRYMIVADWLSRKYGLPTVTAMPSLWRRVFTEGQCAVYERVPDHLDASSAAAR